MSTKSVLITAGDDDELNGLASYLAERGLSTEVASEQTQALAMIQHEKHDVVLVDMDLPGLVVTDFVEAILRIRPATKITVITGTETPAVLRRLAQSGVTCYAKRPLDREQFFLQMQRL